MLFVFFGERFRLVLFRQAARIKGVAGEIVLVGIVGADEGNAERRFNIRGIDSLRVSLREEVAGFDIEPLNVAAEPGLLLFREADYGYFDGDLRSFGDSHLCTFIIYNALLGRGGSHRKIFAFKKIMLIDWGATAQSIRSEH